MRTLDLFDFYEAAVKLSVPVEMNPFDLFVHGEFISATGEAYKVSGFYDGKNSKDSKIENQDVFKIRFMPEAEGKWNCSIKICTASKVLYEKTDSFECVKSTEKNYLHGPVVVKDKFHFSYTDGTKYAPMGTTCYVWELQSDERIEETFQTLKNSCFNKIRFCIFPKHYDYNFKNPRSFPFEGTPVDNSKITHENFGEYNADSAGNNWDFSRFNPKHFQHIEQCILRLREMEIEADIILFHPYDRWGFSKMPQEVNLRYLKYVIARFAAFSNVWWAMANEYDLFGWPVEKWEEIGNFVKDNDPYNHLRSIHNCVPFYDHTKPWITHCSIQRQDIYKTAEYTNEWREKFQKPVVLDEISYEGNIQWGWGNVTGQEIVRRCWEASVRGGYGSHSETFFNGFSDTGSNEEQPVLWWSHGGKLHGESEPRLAFLQNILMDAPDNLKFQPNLWDDVHAVPENDDIYEKTGYELFYYTFQRPGFREYNLNPLRKYKVEIIDTWEMTVKDAGVFSGKFRIELPGKQYMAVRIRYAE